MAENAWLANDTAPLALAQEFAPPATESTDVYWGGPASMAFAVGGQGATATPTGVSSTSAIGTVAAMGGALLVPTGQAIAAAAGMPVADGGATADVSSVENSRVLMTTAIGAPSARGAGTAAALEGIAATSAIGDVAATGGAVGLPEGVASAAAVGDAAAVGEDVVSSDGSALATPVGLEAVAAVGTPAVTGAALVDVAGVAAVSDVGQSTALLEVVSPLPAAGLSGVSSPIPFTPTRRRGLAMPAGVEARTAVGQVVAIGGGAARPAGVAATLTITQPTATGIRNPSDDEWAALTAAA